MIAIVYYNRTKGHTTNDYKKARDWWTKGDYVLTYNFLKHKVYDWVTNQWSSI